MEYMGSLSRPSTAEPDNRPTPADNSDSSSRVNEGPRPLFYTSAAPAARMQIITRPLSGVHADASVKLTSRERSRLIISTVLSVLFVILIVFTLAYATGIPDLGLKIEADAQGRQVVTAVAPYDIGADQGVKVGDIVLSDIQSSAAHTVTILQPSHPSSPITVTSNGGTALSPFQRWSFIILALIFMGVGGPVYVKARHRVAASAFYAFCAASALSLLIAPLTYLGNGIAVLMMFLSLMVWSSSFALFFLKFPVRAGKTKRRHQVLVSLVYIAGFITIGTYLLIFFFDLQHYLTARFLGYIYIVFCAILGLSSLGRALIRERTAEVRQQMTILLGGTGLAVLPSLLLGILPSLFGLPNVRTDLTVLTLGIMPLSFAYAITQGQLLGVRNFIRRGLVYVVMGFSVLIVFALLAAPLSAIVPDEWKTTEITLIGASLFVFLIALSYGYVQKYVERMVDKYIYHDAYDYKEALLHFSAQLAAEQNLPTLADELVDSTCRMMNLTCGVLLLATPLDKDANLQAELLLNDMDHSGGSGETAWGALRGAGHLIGGSGIFADESNGAVNQHSNTSGQQTNGTEPDSMLRVVPYARYGDFADWLIEGLHYELSQLGIRLDQADGPMQLIYFNRQGGELDAALHTGRLQTQPLREGILSSSNEMTVTGTLYNNGRSGGSLTGYSSAHSSMSDFGSADMVTGGLQPTRKLDFESIRSFLGVPLWTRSRFVGVLCLGGKRTGERFTKDDLSLLSTLGSQAALAIFNAQLSEAREQALLDTIGALAHAIEAKDGYTIQHCENMTGRAVALAQAMGLPAKELENIRMGAILHDIGKIGIPDAVLNKPGKLTNEEYELMKQHAAIGARIVQSVGALQGVVPIIRYHQERYDGSGYPEGLKGEEIPIGARIIGVVDTYGAMTEDRVYRATPGHQRALDELQRLAGKQFDPTVVEAFIALLEEHPEYAELRAYIA
jgi:putative nucleotidyltransferase with HDIG domain